LETGKPKGLVLTNWVSGEWFGRPGINFNVVEEDGEDVEQKQYTITSRQLIMQFKPILIKAESEGKSIIAVSILRSGEGMNTRYKIQEVARDE
jgi:hypothetical protein